MHTFTPPSSLASQAQTMLTQRRETYAYLAAIVAQHRAKTFKDAATAVAVIAGLGRDAAAAMAWDEATVTYLNSVGPMLGQPVVPSAIPDGYGFTANADGTGSVTCPQPPAAGVGTRTGAHGIAAGARPAATIKAAPSEAAVVAPIGPPTGGPGHS